MTVCTEIDNMNYRLPDSTLQEQELIVKAKVRIAAYVDPDPIPDNFPEGSKKQPDGSIITPDGTVVGKDGTITLPDGTVLKPGADGKKPTIDKEGNVTDIHGVMITKDGDILLPGEDLESKEDDTWVKKGDGAKAPSYDPENILVKTHEDNQVILPGEKEVMPPADSEISIDGTITQPDGTVITPDGKIYNTDGSIQSLDGKYLRPATPRLIKAEVYSTGNRVRAELSGECAGATGYDYVISKNINCIKDKDYLQVSKNILRTDTSFTYVPKGTYYVYCHAWVRGEDGNKVFSKWSNYKTVTVTAETPQTPQIEKIRVRGNTVTVTYAKCDMAAGYDTVLGSAYRKISGEYRPVDYGKYVIKSVGSDKVVVRFTNVKKGTYYAGLHAWNRTSEDKKKVFSPWSKTRKIIVK